MFYEYDPKEMKKALEKKVAANRSQLPKTNSVDKKLKIKTLFESLFRFFRA